ncbi:MAG: T9SS type A sorting domain-containing protein [Bacteroidales bacterium]|nr:T9SS type A sorting domain-containing protein [Bacteroidales bacterium]
MKTFTKSLFITVLFITVISFSVEAQTNVSGGIYSNTTWTKANSPYIVTDTVVVFANVTLTIEPGVTVRFNDKTGLEMRQAKLIAIGTKTDSITFTSDASYLDSIYPGILLNKGMLSSSFNYCNFRYLNAGIGCNTYTNSILTVRNSNFSNNNKGIYSGYLVSSEDNVYIDSCYFYNNSVGIDFGSSFKTIKINDCVFIKNAVGFYGAHSKGNFIKNCIIDNNKLGMDLNKVLLENCKVSNNKTGIESHQSIIKNSYIFSNFDIGIQSHSDSIYNCNIYNNYTGITGANFILFNNFIDNNQFSIKTEDMFDTEINLITGNIITNSSYGILATKASITATNNTIENHSVGISINNSNSTISCNRICNNKEYNLKYSGTNNFSVANNYWCSFDSTFIASSIYDGYDYVKYGLVSFMPLDTTSCHLGNCNLQLSAIITKASCSNCQDGSATVTVINGSEPYLWEWFTTPVQNTQTATGLKPGVYKVCVKDAANCFACLTVNVESAACSALFDLYPTGTPHFYEAVNKASGVEPLKYLWEWGDGKTDTVPYPTHTYDTAGYYNICLHITDSVGCQNSWCNNYYLNKSTKGIIQVTVIPFSISINENKDISSVKLSPNPCIDELFINVSHFQNVKHLITVYDIRGTAIYQTQNTQSSITINTRSFPPGLYLVRIQSPNSTTTRKFIKF